MKTLVLILTFAALMFSSAVAEAGIVEGVVRPGEAPLEPPPVVDVDRPCSDGWCARLLALDNPTMEHLGWWPSAQTMPARVVARQARLGAAVRL